MPLPSRPGCGLLLIHKHHFTVIGQVLFDKVEGSDADGFRNQMRLESISSIEGHEKSHGPQIVGLIMLLDPLPDQMVLRNKTKAERSRVATDSPPTAVEGSNYGVHIIYI